MEWLETPPERFLDRRRDPITRCLDRVLRDRIPGAARSEHFSVRGGHFLQEVSGARLAEIVVDTARRAPAE